MVVAVAALFWTPTSSTAAIQSSTDVFFRGDGTVYTLSDPKHGNCNFMAYPSDAVTKYAALNSQQWDTTKNCGRCAEVTCTDSRCVSATKLSEIVHIVDQCPGCVAGDLDLSPTVFKAITGFESDRLQIKWKFVDCPAASKIKYCLKKGSNEFWAAIQPTNFVVGVASVKVNGQTTAMVDSAYYFLLDGKSVTKVDLSKVTITVLGLNGEVIEDTVSFASSDCVEGTKQLTPGNGAGQTQPIPLPSVTPSSAPTPNMTPVSTPAPQTQGSVLPHTPATTEPPAPWTQDTASSLSGSTATTTTPATSATSSSATSSTMENEVAGEADRAAAWDGEVKSTTEQASATTTAPAQGGDSFTSRTSTPSSGHTDVERIKTETEAGGRTTSPAVIALSALGCLAAVVLVVLAVYVNKKKLDDKRADRVEEGSFGSAHLRASHNLHALALTSQNSSAPSGSFCQVQTPSGERRSTNFAVL